MTISKAKRSEINRANGRRQRDSFWTDERKALLRRLWKPGANAYDIATEIGAGCTRDMVIGKANRLELPALPVNMFRAVERRRAAFLLAAEMSP